jgi:hypothetical protein
MLYPSETASSLLVYLCSTIRYRLCAEQFRNFIQLMVRILVGRDCTVSNSRLAAPRLARGELVFSRTLLVSCVCPVFCELLHHQQSSHMSSLNTLVGRQ